MASASTSSGGEAASGETGRGALLLRWLTDEGALLDGIRIGPSALGGVGAFGRSKYRQGQRLFQIPQACVLTTTVASESYVGLAASAAADQLSEDVTSDPRWLDGRVMLWLFVAIGRNDEHNAFYPYLQSLPAESPEPCCWRLSLRKELSNTSAGAAIEEARAFVELVYRELKPHLDGMLPSGCLESVDELHWARGMCVSRSFPGILGAGARSRRSRRARGVSGSRPLHHRRNCTWHLAPPTRTQ